MVTQDEIVGYLNAVDRAWLDGNIVVSYGTPVEYLGQAVVCDPSVVYRDENGLPWRVAKHSLNDEWNQEYILDAWEIPPHVIDEVMRLNGRSIFEATPVSFRTIGKAGGRMVECVMVATAHYQIFVRCIAARPAEWCPCCGGAIES